MGDLLQPTHLLVLFVVMLVLFGGSRLPGLGKGLGEGLRGFKDGLMGSQNHPQNHPKTDLSVPGAKE